MPTFNLDVMRSFEIEAIDQGVFDDVPERVVGVIGGVRGDEHIRQPLKTQKAIVGNRSRPTVGVEDALLALNNVERRAA
jgi:hypothetical protein